MTLRPRRVGVNGTSTYDVFHAPSRDGTASATEGSVSLKLRSSTRFLTGESRPCAYPKMLSGANAFEISDLQEPENGSIASQAIGM